MALPKGKHLYIDCFAGIAGDMFLGAMLDLGVPEQAIRDGLALLPWSGYTLQISPVQRMGISGCDLKVLVDQADQDQEGEGTDHHHHHGHRAWREIRRGIQESALDQGTKSRAHDIFGRIARAEASVHGVPEEEVSFHEVGALDSIVDVVGAAIALEQLSPGQVTCRTIPLGQGTVRCQHGIMPVPPPATVEILKGARVEHGGAEMEMCTPTGAAIVQSCVSSFGKIPAGNLLAWGYGAGDKTLEDRPNHLRLLLVEAEAPDEAEQEATLVEANVDNMSPEGSGYLMERLFEAGARDVWYTPIVMKKGRPALKISVLCAASRLSAVGDMLFAESTTIGLRHYLVDRRTLSREMIKVETPYGEVPIKVARDGERVLNAAPEFEVCRDLAGMNGVPLKEIHAAAVAAYYERSREDG